MDHPMPDMSMIWNWQTHHFKVIFKWWHVQTSLDFFLTLIVLFSFSFLWEYLQYLRFQLDVHRYRHLQTTEERQSMLAHEGGGLNDHSDVTSLPGASGVVIDREEGSTQGPLAHVQTRLFLKSSLMYTLSHALSIFLMLAYMTLYNGYIILVNLLGAALGYYCFRKDTFLPTLKSCCG